MHWPTIIKSIESTNMTQQQIADYVPTSQGHISDLRNGRRGRRLSWIVAERLIKLARERGVDPELFPQPGQQPERKEAA